MKFSVKTMVQAVRSSMSNASRVFGFGKQSAAQLDETESSTMSSSKEASSLYQHEYPEEFKVKSSMSISPKFVKRLFWSVAIAGLAYVVYAHPPLQTIGRGEVGVRVNQLTGQATQFHEGSAIVIPGLFEMRHFSLLDHTYKPSQTSDTATQFQSIEGLSLGVDVVIRYALDPNKVAQMSRGLPENISRDLVEPQVQGVIYKAFTKFTVREIFSSKRAEIQDNIEKELKPKLAADGIILKAVMLGKIELPEDYKRGMEKLLAEELESEKMRYTLELKEKLVAQTKLESEAEKIRREKAAEAAGNEQVIAARAQEEAMKHVLPFKQKQIEQRQYEAEAEKMSRIKTSEGTAQARVIEAAGEADSRRKLADAEVYRQDLVGKSTSTQLERDGALLSKHPLLIQKIMADKLSDKVSVIIAAPPANGGFIGANLLGTKANEAKVNEVNTDTTNNQ
jgi:regulator of protease activity HflC (stomatin/prohibitin superfamily)